MQPLDVSTDESFRSFLPGIQNPQGEDDPALIVRFFVKPKLMGAKSEAAGRQIFEDREMIEIIIKGQPHGIYHDEVRQQHKDKFPRAYARFQAGKPETVIGTPIEMLPGVGPSQALGLKALHLRTIEDVSRVSDESTLQRIGMGARELVNRAKAYLDKTSEATVGMKAELEAMRRELEAMRAMNAPKKRGRKAKAKPEKAAQVAEPKAPAEVSIQ